MSEQSNVKVFISWSGDLAKDVAVALREWLPLLFDRVEPWASDSDIAAGQRGLAHIESELSNTRFGIVVVTSANQQAPWINFEAGALSKTIQGDVEHRVVPLLVDLAGPSQLTGPLSQFQAKTADEEGIRSMLRSLAAVAGIEARVADQRFDAYWPQLAKRIGAAKDEAAKGTPTQPRREQADVLDEILVHVRALRSEAESAANQSMVDVDFARARQATKVRRRSVVDLKNWMTQLATEHDLEIYDFAESLSGPAEVMVSTPSGTPYSQAKVDAFTREMNDRFGDRVRVTALPF